MRIIILSLFMLFGLMSCKDSETPSTEISTTPEPPKIAAPLNAEEQSTQELFKKAGIDCSVTSLFNQADRIIVLCEGKGYHAILKNSESFGQAFKCADASCKTPDELTKDKQEIANHASTKWIYNSYSDPMTSKSGHTARVRSENTVNFGFPYEGDQHAELTLRKDPKHGYDAYFSIEEGQILCNSYNGCNLNIRFDEESAQNFSAAGPTDLSSNIVFIENFDRFYSKLKKAKIVRMQVPFYQEGSRVFEFNVEGFDPERFKGK